LLMLLFLLLVLVFFLHRPLNFLFLPFGYKIKTRGRRRAATGCCCYRPPTRMNEPNARCSSSFSSVCHHLSLSCLPRNITGHRSLFFPPSIPNYLRFYFSSIFFFPFFVAFSCIFYFLTGTCISPTSSSSSLSSTSSSSYTR
jgi:hypothetical protein